MKKLWLSLFLSGALILGACSNDDADAPADEHVDNDTEEVADQDNEENEGTEGLSAEDILTQSMEAMNAINSFSSEMKVDQVIDFGEVDPELGSSSMTTGITMNMDAMMEPFSMYQTIEMAIDELGDSFTSETYLTEDGMFQYEPSLDEWLKYPDEMHDEILALGSVEATPEEQIELLRSFGDEIEVTEEGDSYVLTVSGSDQNLEALADEVMSMTGAAGEEMEFLLNMMTISDLSYSLYINKETFLQEAIDMTMTMELNMEEEGVTMTMTQTTSGTFTNYDQVDTIVVPDEVIDSAVEIDEEMLGGLEGMEEDEIVEEEDSEE
ncbi:DUF6612 family protein [Alkalihalobacillus pseudalcaliphilus]|uniref:DUF6612 family protein n=1 Tax=Alkalihalobacillus pseudalcaliphilus TaxID=79884 RepID=UPI00064DECEA|nr:DUF6612 family protein [Alkalihalobacillus pseudalcaliphilus]KMK77437.1 hypothetical protein AB990_02880 [Alkalihalobacillus pseudalcaliphilus]